MKFTVANSAFYPAAKQVAGIALEKSPAEILKNVLIKTEGDGNVTLCGHDLDRSLVVTVAAEVTEPGAACVNAKRFAALLKAIDNGAIVKVSADSNLLTLQAGRSRFKFDSPSPEDFPPALSLDGEAAEVALDDALRHRLFEQPEIAISTEETRYYLNGVFLRVDGANVIAVATDGHKLVRGQAQATITGEWPPIIVRKEAVTTMTALGGDRIATNGRIVQMTAEGITFASKVIDGAFPDWQRVVPQSSKNTVEFDRTEMLEALTRFKAMLAEKQDNACKLEWTAGGDTLQLQLSRTQVAEDAVPAVIGEKDGVVGVNSKYFAEILETLDAKRVRFDSADPGSPIRITASDNEHVLAVVMPMRW